jgi:CRISPR system Cascade subunit CasE
LEREVTHLVDIRIDVQAMLSWARSIGIGSADIGYIVHSTICAAYGQFRPQPFRHFEDGRTIRVLGYCAVSADSLASERKAVAEPAVSAAVISELSKEMPSEWTEGARYAFTVRVAPIVQKDRKQIDAYLRSPEGSTRDEVYLIWLGRRMSDAAEIIEAKLESFSLETVSRRPVSADEAGRRPLGKRFTIPSALISGVVGIKNGGAFAKLVADGIGRHGAFGYGALLLRPSKPTA